MPEFITHIGVTHYVVMATVLFTIGLAGVMTSRNVVRVLLSVELMLSAVNLNFVAFNNYLQPASGLLGQVFAIFVLTVSAAEASVGLAIVIALYRARASADMEKYNLLKW